MGKGRHRRKPTAQEKRMLRMPKQAYLRWANRKGLPVESEATMYAFEKMQTRDYGASR